MKHHLLQMNRPVTRAGRAWLDTLFNGALLLAAVVFILSGVTQGALATGQPHSTSQITAQRAAHGSDLARSAVTSQLKVVARVQGQACATGKLI
jgi:hypothetical protein